MNTLLTYLLLSSICLAIFYIAYKRLFAKETFYRLNRLTILGSITLALILPLVSLDAFNEQANTLISDVIYTVNLNEVVIGASTNMELAKQSEIPLINLIYLLGLSISLILTLYGLGKIKQLLNKSEKRINQGTTTLYIHKDSNQKPFSWNHKIMISQEDFDNNREEILTHENAHIHFKHTWDILFIHGIAILQWFNPFIWLFKKELQRVHEYQADEYVLQTGINAQKYQLLLIKKSVGNHKFNLANNFCHRDLPKRIKMMVNKKSKSKARWKYSSMLPLCLIAFIIVGKSKTVQAQSTSTPIPTTVAETPTEVDNTLLNAKDTAVYTVVEQMPEFVGGLSELLAYLKSNVAYPEEAVKKKAEGRVIISFVVNADGHISDVKVKRGVDPILDEKAIEVVKAMPNWIPGVQDGKKVAVQYTLPIMFRLPVEEPDKTAE